MSELSAFLRYAAGLPASLRRPLTAEAARRRLRAGLERREEQLLDTLERGVYGYPASPYRPLLARAGAELGDVRRLVADEGVEGALGRLYDEGVHIRLEEFKGRAPIARPGLAAAPAAPSFDNPLLAGARLAVLSAGSGGRTRRAVVDLPHLRHEAAYQSLFVEAFGLQGRPHALWRPVLPGAAGLKNAVGYSLLGLPVERWFSPNRLQASAPKEVALTWVTLASARLFGAPIGRPRHVPVSRPEQVAAWLAAVRAAGRPAVLDMVASSAVRVALAARDRGLDLGGTLFRCGGEPLTEAKAAAVAAVGAQGVCHYSMSDVGRAGVACARGAAADDVHLALDKLGVVQREREVAPGIRVGALVLTTLAPSTPKLLLNVEVDDYGVLERRACGCAAGEVGLDLHLRSIRSYEKLTTAGMSFLGPDLLTLLEEVLPGRFGGGPGDYQLVEEEDGGLTRVLLVVSPRVGSIDEEAVVRAALDALGRGPRHVAMAARIWAEEATLRVARREPYTTHTAKVQPLVGVRR